MAAQLASAGLTEGSAPLPGDEGAYHRPNDDGGAENLDPRAAAGGGGAVGGETGGGPAPKPRTHVAGAAGGGLCRERFEALPGSTRGRVTFETVSAAYKIMQDTW